MPRSNRPRGSRPNDDDELDLTRVLGGTLHTEVKRGIVWNVQPVSAVSAQKPYRCPGCSLDIVPGTAHLVAWRAEEMLGDAAALAARRHWHPHCWKIA